MVLHVLSGFMTALNLLFSSPSQGVFSTYIFFTSAFVRRRALSHRLGCGLGCLGRAEEHPATWVDQALRPAGTKKKHRNKGFNRVKTKGRTLHRTIKVGS